MQMIELKKIENMFVVESVLFEKDFLFQFKIKKYFTSSIPFRNMIYNAPFIELFVLCMLKIQTIIGHDMFYFPFHSDQMNMDYLEHSHFQLGLFLGVLFFSFFFPLVEWA